MQYIEKIVLYIGILSFFYCISKKKITLETVYLLFGEARKTMETLNPIEKNRTLERCYLIKTGEWASIIKQGFSGMRTYGELFWWCHKIY